MSERRDLPPAAAPDAGAPQETEMRLVTCKRCGSPIEGSLCGYACDLDDTQVSERNPNDIEVRVYTLRMIEAFRQPSEVVAPAAHQETPEPRLVHAARLLAKSLPDALIEALREEWGNTNLAVLKHWRDETLRLLDGAPARAAEQAEDEDFVFPTPPRGPSLKATMGERRERPKFYYESDETDEAARAAEWHPLRELIARMRGDGPRFKAQYGGMDVVYANDVDDWADELEKLLPPGALAGDSNSKR